jgi:hypothetical protein
MADVILPELPEDEEYVVRKKPKTELQLLRDKRDEIISDMSKFIEPTRDDLVETGKMMHPYWIKKRELDQIKSRIDQITG